MTDQEKAHPEDPTLSHSPSSGHPSTALKGRDLLVALDSPDRVLRPAPEVAADAADADDFLHRLVNFYRIYNPDRLKQGLDEIYASYHFR